MPAYQSAYHRDHSCETSLLNLCDKIVWRMERQHVSCLLVMDQSEAFDTICTDNLLQVLSKKFGIGGSALNWYDQYLQPRKFYVNIEGSKLSVHYMKTGVPQGSSSSANLFTALVSTLPDVIETSVSVQLRNASEDLHIDDVELKVNPNGFANDHLLNNGFDPNNPASEDKAVSVMEYLMQDIKEWMSQNRLELNAQKRDFMFIGSRQKLCKCHTGSIRDCDDVVYRSKIICLLGAWINRTLSFKHHIKQKCKSAMFNLFRIRSIRQYLTQEATQVLVRSLVMLHIDYANSLLTGLPQCDIQKLQTIQNMAVKLTLNEDKI